MPASEFLLSHPVSYAFKDGASSIPNSTFSSIPQSFSSSEPQPPANNDNETPRRRSDSLSPRSNADILQDISITTLAHPHQTARKSTKYPAVSSHHEEITSQEFTFVHSSTGPGKRQNQNAQKLIKSTARRWAYADRDRRRQGIDRSSSGTSRSSSISRARTRSLTPGSAADNNVFFPESLDEFAVLDACSSSSMSPINLLTPLPLQTDPFQRFADYFNEKIAPMSYPLAGKMMHDLSEAEWMLQDEACRAVLRYMVNLFMVYDPEYMEQAEDPVMCMDAAVQVLMPRLSSMDPPTDGTIFAVATLAMVEHWFGNEDQCTLHLEGLVNLVSTRGGIEWIGGMARAKVSQAVIRASMDSLTSPILQNAPRLHPPISLCLTPGKLHTIAEDAIHALSIVTLDKSLQDSYMQLWCLSAALDEALQCDQRSTHPAAFFEETTAIQYALLGMMSDLMTPMERACQIGALIYTATLERVLPFPQTHSRHVFQTLKMMLVEAKESGQYMSSSRHIWLYAMGAITSHGHTEYHEWFLLQIDHALAPIWLGGGVPFLVLKNELLRIMWIDCIHDSFFEKCWDDYQRIRVRPKDANMFVDLLSENDGRNLLQLDNIYD